MAATRWTPKLFFFLSAVLVMLMLVSTGEEVLAKPVAAETESSMEATAALSTLLNSRRALQRGRWDSKEDGKCMNTVQGELLLTDDRGYVCPVEDIDATTGCCLRGSGPNICAGCDSKSKCCLLYETCVSCCMHPNEKASERMGIEYRVRNRSTTGHFETVFEFCSGMCRTTKDCTLHENGYRSDFKYCFNEDGVPPKVFPRDPLPNKHVEVISAEKGRTCTDECLKNNMNCSHRLLEQINTCEEMKSVFNCKNCEKGTSPDMPSYDDTDGTCYITNDLNFLCSYSDPKRERLCPCV